MDYSENALNILTCMTFKGVGRAWIVKNIGTQSPDIYTIISNLNATTKREEEVTISEFEEKRSRIWRIIHANAQYIDGIVALGDSNFPQHRGYVKNSDRPVFLFYKGDISLLKQENRNIAVIGLLNPDSDIELTEKKIVSKLVERKATVISGLALGCDTIAHEQTLACGGKTVAFLPGTLASILPSSNKNLAERIVMKGGLLATEYLTEVKSKKMLSSRYQERDRLQALYSDGIILSASYAKNDQGNDSGSRLAMQYAKEYQIRRALIYDDDFAENPKFDLNRQYIEEEKNIVIINKHNHNTQMNKLLGASKTHVQPSLFA